MSDQPAKFLRRQMQKALFTDEQKLSIEEIEAASETKAAQDSIDKDQEVAWNDPESEAGKTPGRIWRFWTPVLTGVLIFSFLMLLFLLIASEEVKLTIHMYISRCFNQMEVCIEGRQTYHYNAF